MSRPPSFSPPAFKAGVGTDPSTASALAPLDATRKSDSSPDSVREQLLMLRSVQDQLFAQLQNNEQHFRGLARSVWRVQEDERRRLARELHDGIGQHLAALKHRVEALSSKSDAADGETRKITRNEFDDILQILNVAIGETRSLSRFLRPQILDDLGLEAALRWLARSLEQSSACQFEIDIASVAGLDGDLTTLVFRLAQEAFNNALKHAAAKHVVLRLAQRADQLVLLIVDDGRGCEVAAALQSGSHSQSSGLVGMRERVRLFGGQFNFQSNPGEGTQLRVVIPLSSASEIKPHAS